MSFVLLFSSVEIFSPQVNLKGQAFSVLPGSDKDTSTRLSSQGMLKVG